MSQTIDQIFLSTADREGEKLALSDCPGAARLGLSNLEPLTYTQSANYIRHTANFLRQLGFAEGDIVVVQMPNIAETYLVLLSLLNAGLIPCLIPSHWRSTELNQALSTITPKAIIIHETFVDYDPFPAIFEMATENLGLRYIFGLGNDLPDGVTPLPDLPSTIEAPSTEAQAQIVFQRNSEQVAFISWSRDADCNASPVAYTHLQLMANAHFITSMMNVKSEKPNILTTYPPTNPIGLIAAFIPWVVDGGTLHIASSLKMALRTERLQEHNIDIGLIPQSLGSKLIDRCLEGGLTIEDIPHLGLVSPTPHKSSDTTPMPEQGVQATYLYNLNGLCIYPRRAIEAGQPGLMRLGPVPGPGGETLNPPFIETRIQGATQKASEAGDILKGRLELNGTAVGFKDWQPAMTTTPISNYHAHWEATALTAIIIDQAMSTIDIEPAENTLYYGSNPLNTTELDSLYQSYPGFVDAAAFSIKDPLLGERLFAAIIPQPGGPLSYEDFKNHLIEQNISPTKIPEKLVTVEVIPRNQDGIIERSAILTQAQR